MVWGLEAATGRLTFWPLGTYMDIVIQIVFADLVPLHSAYVLAAKGEQKTDKGQLTSINNIWSW